MVSLAGKMKTGWSAVLEGVIWVELGYIPGAPQGIRFLGVAFGVAQA